LEPNLPLMQINPVMTSGKADMRRERIPAFSAKAR
jgi:hypothetical protein